MNHMIPIFIIHGLGGTTTSLKPLQTYLKINKYSEVHLITYPVQTIPLKESIQYVSDEILKIIGHKKIPIIIIGQSLGGVICHELHRHGLNIQKSITIGSPHHGSWLLKFIKYIAPKNIIEYLFNKPIYNDLLKQQPKIPPHPHYTISTSVFPYIPFDGQVWVNETKIINNNHHHININNHWTIFIDPRLFILINNMIQDKIL